MTRARGASGGRGRRRDHERARAGAGVHMALDVSELAPGGSGVAIALAGGERRAIFVDGVITGERVEAEVDLSTRPARGRLLRVIEASPDRIAPACRHVEACGACDWMHVAPGARARAHGAMLERLLRDAFPGASARVHAPGDDLGYRVRARVHVEGRGTRVGSGGAVKVGMFGRRSREPVEVDACVVLHPALDRARRALAELFAGATGRGEAQLSLGAARKPVLDLRWRGGAGLPREIFARAEEAVKAGALAGLRIFDGDVAAPAVIGDPTPLLTGADGLPLRLAPGGFSQASEAGNAALGARVAELAGALASSSKGGEQTSAPKRGALLELYAGAGNLTVLLARAHDVVAVEADHDACVAARHNLAARGLSARVVEADASTHTIPASAKVVVLDPPRAGAKEVARALAARAAAAVVYVSCDPPTLARDLATLAAAGYELASLEAFEMFPQTSHVETMAALTPPKGRR